MFNRLFHRNKQDTYQVDDIFISSYQEMEKKLTIVDIAFMIALKNEIADLRAARQSHKAGRAISMLLHKLCKKKRILKSLSPEARLDVYEDLFIHKPYYRFYLPSISTSNMVFRAPDDHLADVTFNNFKFIDSEFSKCAILGYKHQDFTHELARLAATLYLPYTGSERVEFHPSFMEYYAPLIKKRLTINEAILILNTYAHIRGFIINKYPYLFPQEKSLKSEAPKYSGETWKHIHYSLADTEAFKGYDKAGSANVYDALGYLDWKARQNMEINKSLAKK